MTDLHDDIPAGAYCYHLTVATAADDVPRDMARYGTQLDARR